MATIQDRHNSGLYSGLANNAVFTVIMASIGLVAYESLRRIRGHTTRPDIKGTQLGGPLGSIETWEFGYLYQGRSWSKRPPPCTPSWPLAWIKQAIMFPESEMPQLLRGLDSVIYVRFLRGCWYFVLAHVLTSLPILLPIHLASAPSTIPYNSLERASLIDSSTTDSFLWAHLVVLYWICATWLVTLVWITRGALQYRRELIRINHEGSVPADELSDYDKEHRGWRYRSIMVENIPEHLRKEDWLRDYFEKYLAKSTLRSAYLQRGWWGIIRSRFAKNIDDMPMDEEAQEKGEAPRVVAVVLARKTSELQALLTQRETIIRTLEALHVKLAKKVLAAVAWKLAVKDTVRASSISPHIPLSGEAKGDPQDFVQNDGNLDALTEQVAPFLTEFKQDYQPSLSDAGLSSVARPSVWEALLSLPPELLHPYQPLIRMKPRYRGRLDVAIDYYALKLATIDKSIDEERSRDPGGRDATSTAFVTFAKPQHARKAFRFLAFHPRAPDACLVTPAPDPSDLNWSRVMQATFRGAFVKDWIIAIGVWAFTLLWVIPVTIIVGLFSITNIASLFPGLQSYFNANPAKQSLISSFLPTLLVSLLAISIQPLLYLIAAYGHTIVTTSKLNDTVLTRYWKFLVCNTVFFFSLGVSTVGSFVQAFEQPLSLLPVVADNFSAAAPFYVGWLVFEIGMHSGMEIALLGFPVWLYPLVRGASTLRRRYEAMRPRNYDFSYWLPTHLLVILIMHVFSVLNPLIIPICFIYLSIEIVVLKHQFLHVYSRAYEGNGFMINYRLLRFSCDGLIFSQAIFLALMILLHKIALGVLTGILILATIVAKLYLSRKCMANNAAADKAEADLVCGMSPTTIEKVSTSQKLERPIVGQHLVHSWTQRSRELMLNTWRSLPFETDFSYAVIPRHNRKPLSRPAIPFARGDSARSGSSNAPHVGHAVPQTTGTTITQGQFAPSAVRPVDDQTGDATSENITSTRANTSREERLKEVVRRHPPTAIWDDTPQSSATYDNPFSTSACDNFLWLPRNPLANLDLDDSVDFYGALLSRPEEGWRGLGQMPERVEIRLLGGKSVASDVSSSTDDGAAPGRRVSLAAEPLLGTLTQHLSRTRSESVSDGEERTDLPPIIAARLENIDQERDVEEAETPTFADRFRRPSLARKHSSSVRRRISQLSPFPADLADGASLDERALSNTPGPGPAPVPKCATTLPPEGELPEVATHAPEVAMSSFRALANEVLEESRREKEARDKRERGEGAGHRSRWSKVFDSRGQLRS